VSTGAPVASADAVRGADKLAASPTRPSLGRLSDPPLKMDAAMIPPRIRTRMMALLMMNDLVRARVMNSRLATRQWFRVCSCRHHLAEQLGERRSATGELVHRPGAQGCGEDDLVVRIRAQREDGAGVVVAHGVHPG